MATNKQKILSLNDLGTVLTELHPARDKWYNIGLRLLVPVTELQRIESEYKNDHGTCLRQMLIRWLEGGAATWATLIEALQAPIVHGDENKALADNLRKKYCGEGESQAKAKKRKSACTEAMPGGATPAAKKPRGDLPDTIDPDDFVNNPPEDRLCVKCRQVPTNPQLSECCGTVYCQPCSKTKTYCIIHHCVMSYTDDKKLRTKIMDLRCRCPNWRGRCQFKEGVSKVYRQHLPECQIQVQSTSGPGGDRGQSIPTAAGTSTSFTVSPSLVKTELEPSATTPTSRPTLTGAVGSGRPRMPGGEGQGPSSTMFEGTQKSKPSMHMVKVKPKVKCRYHRIGCPRTFPSHSMMEQHLLEDVQHHLDLAIGKIEQLMDTLPYQ